MERLKVTMLGRDLVLSCETSEKENLLAAVQNANDLMDQIKQASETMPNDRVAMMACIQLSLQLLSVQSIDGPFQGLAYGEVKGKLDNINELLDAGINALK